MTERNRFGQFDFQVTNHQLFLTSARMRYEEQHPLLIDSDLVIIDEAHKLHDAALDAMGDQLAENEIKRYVSAVGHLNSNPKKIELYKAILTGLLSNSEKLFGSAKQKAGYDDMELFDYVANTYDLTPAGIIRELDLLHADYETIAEGCHFYNKYNRTGRWK